AIFAKRTVYRESGAERLRYIILILIGGYEDAVVMGNKVNVERVWETTSAKQEIPADQDQDNIAQTFSSTLAVDGALGKNRCQDPDNEKQYPTTADDIS